MNNVSVCALKAYLKQEVSTMTPSKDNWKRAVKVLAIPTLAVAAILSVQAAPRRQEPAPVAGNRAPAIKLEKLLQAPPGASTDWERLRGKVVVIEFWATWCGPCIGQIPHLNQLADELSSQPIVFVSITDDSEEKLRGFLKSTPIKTWIGLDSTRANWSSFDIHSIPTTVIVGADGGLVANTRPNNLTAQMLRDLVNGKSVSLPHPETRDSNLDWDRDEIDWKDGVSPIAEIIIKPISTATSGAWLRPEKNYLTADGAPLEVLVQVAYQTDHYHLDWRIPQPENPQLYRVAARVPKGREQHLLPLFQNALVATFALNIHWQSLEKDVYVLRATANDKPKLTEATSDEQPLFQAMRGRALAKRQRLAKLTEFLCNLVVHAPVVDETNLTGEYDWELPYQPGQLNVALQAVKDRLGLELVKARRLIKMLVVEDESTQRRQLRIKHSDQTADSAFLNLFVDSGVSDLGLCPVKAVN
jgi:uncharacterized protein (TIGR03435 family)